MKRVIIRAASEHFSGDWDEIKEYAKTTSRDSINFASPQIWSIQLTKDDGFRLTYDTEVLVLATTYAEAKQKADYLAESWGYDPKRTAVQFQYAPADMWAKNKVELEGPVAYIEL